MKKSYSFFIWIVLMVLGLMAVLVITQLNSSQSVSRLVSGNKQAAITFAINNRLEDIVNMSFELESKLLAEKPAGISRKNPGLKDSINKLISKADSLDRIISEAAISTTMDTVLNLINRQSSLFAAALKMDDNSKFVDSIKKMHYSDSIYLHALELQTKLEKTLSSTLQDNNKVAGKVSWLNTLLAFTALIAVLILATIILRRQVIQFILIRDLEQARKLALQSVKIKDQFLANMSHEIRTPLNALKGFSRLLSKTNLDDEQQQYTTIINNSSENLLHIVNDILDLSKMEAGAIAIKNNPFSLFALIKEIRETYTDSAAEKALAFHINIQEGLPDRLLGDPERLRQVMVNLISNAIKFTNEGYIKLSITQLSTRNDRSILEFAVEDTGIGIPKDKQELIFERFEQLDNAFIRRQGGTGLGLAITKMIVEAMGGDINVNSQPGAGSVFSFSLSFQVNKQPEQKQEMKHGNSFSEIAEPARFKILLAEDNKVNQLLVKKMLEGFNVDIATADNGHESCTIIEKELFDIVLMDVQMPVMDGITATKVIRTNLGLKLPVIGMTAYVQTNEIEKCLAAGMNDYIPKPINEDTFFSILGKYIQLAKIDRSKTTGYKESNHVDVAYLEKICNHDKVSINLIIKELVKQIPQDISSLDNSLSAKDEILVQKTLHHLKSTLSPLGTDSDAAIKLRSFSEKMHVDIDWVIAAKLGQELIEVLKGTVDTLKNKLNDS